MHTHTCILGGLARRVAHAPDGAPFAPSGLPTKGDRSVLPRKRYDSLGRRRGRASNAPEPPDPLPPSGPTAYVHTCIYACMHIRIYAHACMHVCMYAVCTACTAQPVTTAALCAPEQMLPRKALKPTMAARDQNGPKPALKSCLCTGTHVQ